MNTLPTLNSQSIIINLIKQDLICNKLVLGLSELGLEAGKYHLDIGTIVLQLVGFSEPDDSLLELYYNYMEKALTVNDVEEDRVLLESMALELHASLVEEKKNRDTLQQK